MRKNIANSPLDEGHVGAGDLMIDADRIRERQPKHAEAVGHADAEMDRSLRAAFSLQSPHCYSCQCPLWVKSRH